MKATTTDVHLDTTEIQKAVLQHLYTRS
jgi:hypothetical protein